MEEDVLGPREEVVGDRYTRCTKCGRVTPIDQTDTIAVDGDLATQIEVLCTDCREELDSGDSIWPVGGAIDEDIVG